MTTAARTRGRTVGRTLGALALLQATLPVDSVVTAAALLRRRRAEPAPAAQRRTVLVSGGKMSKSLVLARAFHAAGHRVVLVESGRYRLTAHRFSRAVDAFRVVPHETDPAYAAALVEVARSEGADVYVPVCSPASSIADADVRADLEAVGCEVVHLGPADLRMVDDKASFAEAAVAAGLAVPDSYRITDPQQVLDLDLAGRPRPYILKSIPYDPVRRLDLTLLPRPTRAETEAFVRSLPISPEQPWILQEFVEGTEYCTHGTVRDGRLQMHVCCRSSAWQLTYDHVDHPGIRAWVETFVAAQGEGFTGQVSLDFIEDADGVVRAIECNPRTHSAITLLDGHPGLAAAYLEDAPAGAPALEPVGARPTYWTYHELYLGLRHPRSLPGRLRTLRGGRDAVFDAADPVPFWWLHHVHVPALLLGNLVRLRPWLKIDLNIGKLVEPAGD
ncbi:hypothetical protein ENKNEFLB_00670 [Nocardioides aquaticus]|uniref:ATP-grasp enzyme n=1 Tax=Nocardioides aquaticus TaxID=160826 RepID=A0ABX8ECU8_9ACTN|nr:hypothetical protein ENKNEFLB_00670 [Nocardioides aquaticus]